MPYIFKMTRGGRRGTGRSGAWTRSQTNRNNLNQNPLNETVLSNNALSESGAIGGQDVLQPSGNMEDELRNEIRRAEDGLKKIQAEKDKIQNDAVSVEQVKSMIDHSIEAQTERLTAMFNTVLIDQLAAFRTPPSAVGFPRTNQQLPPPLYRDSNYEVHIPRLDTSIPTNPSNASESFDNRLPSFNNSLNLEYREEASNQNPSLRNQRLGSTQSTNPTVTQNVRFANPMARIPEQNVPGPHSDQLSNAAFANQRPNYQYGPPPNIGRSQPEPNRNPDPVPQPPPIPEQNVPGPHSGQFSYPAFVNPRPNYQYGPPPNIDRSQPELNRHPDPVPHPPYGYYPNYPPPKNGLHNWDLKYDGSSSVERFIMKVDIIRRANHLQWPYVVGNFHCLIKKPADRWYWSWVYAKQIEGVEITWEVLRHALISHFSSAQTDEDVTRLLNDKRQKPSEKFAEFFEEFMGIHDCLKIPKSDAELIAILKRNVNNRLFNLVYNFQARDVDSFRVMVQRVENDLDRRYQAYPFASQQKPKEYKKINEISQEYESETEDTTDAIQVNELRVTGQGQRDNNNSRNNRRPVPRELHCFKCGHPGVTVPNCPKCNRPENESESVKFGDSHSL